MAARAARRVARDRDARPAAVGRPPRRPAQSSSSSAAPRLQRALCFLKFPGPPCPFCFQPHLHAAVTLQQSVAHSAKGGRVGVRGLWLAGGAWGVARRGGRTRTLVALVARGAVVRPDARVHLRRAAGVGRERGGRERRRGRVGRARAAPGGAAREGTPPCAGGAGARTGSCAR